ncbi:hypothetical protein VQL36_02835 [Chengkuizengella sp. SCS-71B]|uniref:hypothetical protein n=1 Tax=Chengkuizengella sp. SCS-71B TaxID=3115290 RepID=UPI0032C241FD
MGVFDKNLCDCCVCPMQCVLEQLVGVGSEIQNVAIIFNFAGATIDDITDVNNFNLFTIRSGSGRRFIIPICQVIGVELFNSQPINLNINLKPVRKDSKGECSCCEDPATDVLKRMIGERVNVRFSNASRTGTIMNVGEGIVILSDDPLIQTILSTCNIQAIEVLT